MALSKNQLVTDNVHGEIQLTPLERDLIRTQTFSRLGHIKQLGLAHLVFPGATHTRFSHSIGCMHIVGKIAEHLELDAKETKLLRLAGLLHDIGQYPLSHAIEAVYRQIAAAGAQSYVEDSQALRSIGDTPLLWRAAAPPPGMDKARDKALARTVITKRPDIRRVFEDHNVSPDEVERIADIIAGRHLETLYGHLLDSDYDCDRLDYVIRDSQSAGVTYGLIELDYLIQNMSIVEVEGARVLAVNRRKALHALEHYLTARYFIYSQVIYHKTVRSFELLAKAAFLGLAELNLVYPSFEEIEQAASKDEFVLFDDSYFYRVLRDYWENASANDQLRGLIDRLLFRRRLPFICEYRSFAKKGAEPGSYSIPHNWLSNQENLSTLAGDAGLRPDQIAVEEVSIEMVPFGAEVPFDLALREEMKAKRAITRSPRLFDDESKSHMYLFEDEGSLLGDLAGKYLRLLRVYVNSDEVHEQERLRSALRNRTGY